MFDNLSDKLQRVFKNLRGEGKLTAENMEAALREIRMALLEADVNFKVVKQLIENIKAKATGEEVLSALSPSQQVVKIVHEELIKILGSHESKLRFANEPPSVFLIVGLQGSGKTTSTGKLARWLKGAGKKTEIVAYCRGAYCVLSFEAVAQLRARGFKARRLEDGYPEWRAAGLPVETG